MNRKDCFEILIDIVDRSEIQKKDKVYLTRAFTYFRQQSLCDYDRRKAKEVLEKEWFEFKKLLSGEQKIFKHLDQFFWIQLEGSLGVTRLYEAAPDISSKGYVSTYDRYETEDFFKHLAERVRRECKESPEKYLLMFGLYCLRAEANLPKIRRDQKMISFIWKYLHPKVNKLGYLEEFRHETKLRNSVKYFLAGHIN